MPFKKFVEVGRVAVLGGVGPDQGKIAAIVNVIDQNRVLIEGPTSGVLRQAYPIKQLQLTPICVKFPFNAPTRVIRKEMVSNKVSSREWMVMLVKFFKKLKSTRQKINLLN